MKTEMFKLFEIPMIIGFVFIGANVIFALIAENLHSLIGWSFCLIVYGVYVGEEFQRDKDRMEAMLDEN